MSASTLRLHRIPFAGLALSGATLLDVLAAMVMFRGQAGLAACGAAALLHVGAVVAVWGAARDQPRSQRWLMMAQALALPLVGPPLAALSVTTTGRGELAAMIEPPRRHARRTPIPDIVRMTDGLPASEALICRDPEIRRTALATLCARADAESIALLRWAASGRDTELAVESALALEDLACQFEAKATTCRAALDDSPGFDTALAAADVLADALVSGLADPALLAPLANEARRYYARAEAFAPDRLSQVAIRWARMEMAALCPTLALVVLERALPSGGAEVQSLHDQVAALAHARTVADDGPPLGQAS